MILEGWKECRILLDGCLGFIDVETAVKCTSKVLYVSKSR